MQEKFRAFVDGQIALDTYLPGSPHQVTPIDGTSPYFLWGRGCIPMLKEGRSQATEAARHVWAMKRRQSPATFEEACAFGNLQVAILLWAQGRIDIPSRKALYEGNDASALMWASFNGHLPIVRFLVDQKANPNATNTIGHTALQWATIAGHVTVARFLLDHGADPGILDRRGYDVSFAAVQTNRLSILVMLTEDAVQAGVVVSSVTAGTAATGGGGVTSTRKLQVIQGAAASLNPLTGRPFFILDPSRRDLDGHSLLHWAAYRNSPGTCQYLIEYWGFDVNLADKTGRTPLILAAREGYSEVVEYLLSCGAHVDTRDDQGCTALHYAKVENHPEAIYALTTYPTVSRAGPRHSSIDSAAVAVGVGGAHEHDNDNGTMSVGKRHAEEREVLLSAEAQGLRYAGKRYVTVREQRAFGTLRMLTTHTLFSCMAAFGVIYSIAMCVVLSLSPPLFSYFSFGMYFFKNALYNAVTGRPRQSTDREADGRPKSPTHSLGLPRSLGESVRGNWRFRARDPANLVVVFCVLLLQLRAWNHLGDAADLVLGSESAIRKNSNSTLTAATADLKNFDGYWCGFLFSSFFESPESMMSGVLVGLLLTAGALMCLCKLTSMRSALKKTEEGDLATAPLWRIIRHRQYRWLHPRLYFLERHTQIPVRAFYCPERDVVVRGYDGYSALLDCPIATSNHVFFVLFLTCVAAFELLLCVWGIQRSRVELGCPADPKWYQDAFAGFYSTSQLNELLRLKKSASLRPGAPALETGVVSFAWLNTIIAALLHGVPCRQEAYLIDLTEWFSSSGGIVRRVVYLFLYYWWPTQVNYYGAWVIHFGGVGFAMAGVTALRQWSGVWQGATQMELANPLAPGSSGDLVMVFPPDLQEATPVNDYSVEEEEYYKVALLEKTKSPLPPSGHRSIYASGSGPVNCVAFLCGLSGRRWRGAMSVSSHNLPVKASMLAEWA